MIHSVGITSCSSIDARRMADAIGPALERAFAQLRGDMLPVRNTREKPGDRVAREITTIVAGRLKGTL